MSRKPNENLHFKALICTLGIGLFGAAAFGQPAHEVVSEACLSGGQGEAYCGCYASGFDSLSADLPSDDAKLFLTTFAGGLSVLGTDETTRLQTELPIGERMQAMTLMTQLGGIREACLAPQPIEAEPVPTETVVHSDTSALDEFVDVCVADGDGVEPCACIGAVFQTEMSEDEFMMMTLVQGANARGESPFDAIASDFGVDQQTAMSKLAAYAPRFSTISQARAVDLAECAPG